MKKSKLLDKIKNLPKMPGAYIFKNKSGVVLYVGKATSLRSRVGSYFSGREEDRYISTAINQIADVKTIETETVLEAFILEQDLIKRLQPKYNAMGKDDKSFSYVLLTKEYFPRFIILRKTEIEKVKSQNSKVKNASQNSKVVQSSAFSLFADARNSSKPSFSRGLNKKIHNTLYNIHYTKIYGPYTSKKQIEIALKILRKIFPYHSKSQKTEKGCLDSQIGLCPGPYDGKISRADYMKNIRGIRMILEGKKKSLIGKLEKEMKVFSEINEFEKAAETRNKIFALKHIRDVALINNENFSAPQSSAFSLLAKARNSSKPSFSRAKKFRVEAYDISNISGQHAVGSMVVFDNINGHVEPNKSEYRKFKIKTIQGADDVGMMKEVLTRRFHNDWPASTRRDSSTRGWPKPDLILLDGGAGHLHMAEEILKNLKLNIALAAVAKGPTRKMSNVKCQMSKVRDSCRGRLSF